MEANFEAALRWYWNLTIMGKGFHPEDDPRDVVTLDMEGEYVPVFPGKEAVKIEQEMEEFWDACAAVHQDPNTVALVISGVAKPDAMFDASRIIELIATHWEGKISY